MSIDFLPPLAAITAPVAPSLGTLAEMTGAQGSGGFAQLVSHGLQELNQQLVAGQADLQRLAAGEVSNLHQLMIRLEESRISMQLMLQVRNRMLESYQEMLRMQV